MGRRISGLVGVLFGLTLLALPLPRASAQEAALTCQNQDLTLRAELPAWHDCDSLRHCRASVGVRVRNCSTGALIPTEIVVAPERLPAVARYRQVKRFELTAVVLSPGAGHRYQVNGLRDGLRPSELVLHFRDSSGRLRQTATLLPTLVSAARVVAQEECRLCDGEFGPQGMLQTLGCNCRTRDAGKLCDDGDACEGVCIYERDEIVRPVGPPNVPATGLFIKPRRQYRRVGRCSEFVQQWGCVSYIERGASQKPPTEIVLPTQACAD